MISLKVMDYRSAIRALLICILAGCCAACRPAKTVTASTKDEWDKVAEEDIIRDTVVIYVSSSKTKYHELQIKFAQQLRVLPDSITHIKLYAFIDKWMDTPYKWGGTDERGIDCSAFAQRLYSEVYDLRLPRTSLHQLMTNCVELFTAPQHLAEGDILFFKTTENKTVSHVGVYLQNTIFINSSSSKGVSLGSLDDFYWKKRFVAAGRINTLLARK